MFADPLRGRFTGVSTDGLVMPALAGLSVHFAMHPLANASTLHSLLPSAMTAGALARLCCFGIVAHIVFSFSFLHRCRTRSRSMLLLSLLYGSAITTYLLAFYLVMSHQAMPVGRILTIYFLTAFTYQTLRYKIRCDYLLKHQETVLILGTGREAQKMWKHIRIDCDRLVVFKGFVAECAVQEAAPDILARTVCTIDSLKRFLQNNVVDTMVLSANAPSDIAFAAEGIRIARDCGVRLLCLYEPYEDLPPLPRLQPVSDHYVDFERKNIFLDASRALKAASDRALAATFLLVLMPMALPLLLLYRLLLGEPALASQSIYGYHRRPFTTWNLRTIPDPSPTTPHASQRSALNMASLRARSLSRLGRFLRISGLCYAPRLWNVCTGDMSFVGPTPVLRDQTPLGNSSELLKRYTMRPGLCWPESETKEASPSPMPMDNEATISYMKHWSLALDWKTLTHWIASLTQRTLSATSGLLLSEPSNLAGPTQRTR
jgi:lipopolysaccharide/colanic/teichoic acid biosynthesis glycosyltransferase